MAELAKDSIDLGIIVEDPETALKFYRDTLGFEYDAIGPMDMGDGTVMHRLLCGTSLIKVREVTPPPPNKSAPGGINASTGNRYCPSLTLWSPRSVFSAVRKPLTTQRRVAGTITVSNLDAMAKQCADAGYTIPMGPVEFRPGVRIMMVEDPDGNWLELVEMQAGEASGPGLAIAKESIDLGIIVEDEVRSVAFYRDVLGFTPDPQMAELPMPDGSVMHRLYCGSSLIKVRQLKPAPEAKSAPGGIGVSTGFRYCTPTRPRQAPSSAPQKLTAALVPDQGPSPSPTSIRSSSNAPPLAAPCPSHPARSARGQGSQWWRIPMGIGWSCWRQHPRRSSRLRLCSPQQHTL